MEPLHARYPFLPAAREAVGAADADLGEVVAEGGSVVERAVERVERAIDARSVGEPHRSDRVELLSYPVARVLVSLLDEPALTDRYADAEARTAVERLRADRDESSRLRSVEGVHLSRASFVESLGLGDAVAETGDGATVDVASYLRLAGGLGGERWRLVNRALAAGRVPVTDDELDELLREAVVDRVAADLPLAVPEPVAEALEEAAAEVAALLSDYSVERAIDAVEPELFPPCMKALEARVDGDEPMAPHSTFAYATFLAAIGMDRGEIAARLEAHPDVDASLASYHVDHLIDRDGAAYLPPSCATMQAYGDCVNRDELCATIGHPLEYYERRLDGAAPGEPQTSRAESQ